MAGWAVRVVGGGRVNMVMGSLWTCVGGFLAMNYAFNKYSLSFCPVAGPVRTHVGAVIVWTDTDPVLRELTAEWGQ